MQTSLFWLMQAVLWFLIVAEWLRLGRSQTAARSYRKWMSEVSLVLATLSLLFTTMMTIYARHGQQRAYDWFESGYLILTTSMSLFGLLLAMIGKGRSRLIGAGTCTFTLVVAFLDAVSV